VTGLKVLTGPKIELQGRPPMRTFTLRKAAAFLHIHPEELRQRAKAGRIPGAKVGRAWVFLEEDLISFVRSLYGPPRQAPKVPSNKEVTCHYAGAKGSGRSTSSVPEDSEYANLLGLPIKSPRKNSKPS